MSVQTFFVNYDFIPKDVWVEQIFEYFTIRICRLCGKPHFSLYSKFLKPGGLCTMCLKWVFTHKQPKKHALYASTVVSFAALWDEFFPLTENCQFSIPVTLLRNDVFLRANSRNGAAARFQGQPENATWHYCRECDQLNPGLGVNCFFQPSEDPRKKGQWVVSLLIHQKTPVNVTLAESFQYSEGEGSPVRVNWAALEPCPHGMNPTKKCVQSFALICLK